MKTGYETVCGFLPPGVRDRLMTLEPKEQETAEEVRLRAGCPFCIVTHGRGAYLNRRGGLSDVPDGNAPGLSQNELEECFRFLTGFSVNAYEEQLAQGFIPLAGGHRAGVCGRAVYRQGKPVHIEKISSVNLRIAQTKTFPLSENVLALLVGGEGGILIGGPPSAGKTTLLRSCIWALAGWQRQVCVVDEREELFPPGAPTPPNCDVLSAYHKAEGILQGIRLLSPAMVFCDEIGGKEEAAAVAQALRAGVRITATLHCFTLEDIRARPQGREMLSTGAFSHYVLLAGGQPGRIADIGRLGP